MDAPAHDTSVKNDDAEALPAIPVKGIRRIVGWLQTTDLHHFPVILVFAMSFGGLAFSAVVPEHWLRGVLVLAAAMLIAGVLRFLLPPSKMEFLAVRGRLVDTGFYLAIGLLIIFFGLILPRQR